MKTITFDLNEIEKLIIKGNYVKSSKEIFKVIESIENVRDNELIYKCLRLLNLICDKNPSISLETVNRVEIFISDPDSWIRVSTLEILYQISMYRPNLLLDLLDQIRQRLFDTDPSVRRLTVKIIGKLILALHLEEEDLNILVEEFTEKLMDNDWKVKFHVIRTLQKILNQDYNKIKDLEPLLSIVIINLRDKDDDVARAAADLLKVLGTYFLSKEKIFYVLLNLLYNEKPRVKELIIWLFGEIGKERSSEIIPIIPKLIKLLRSDDFRIQTKIIDAIVNIAENNFDQIWTNLINSLDTSDPIFKNNIINAMYQLAQGHIHEIFSYIFEELENPSENIREGISLVFKRLYEEYQIEIENEITKILYGLESNYWREREKNIILLRHICFILQSRKIAVWITIELNQCLRVEYDSDVKNELNLTIDKVKKHFIGIDPTIKRIYNELNLFERKIYDFQKIPAKFRRKMNSLIEEFKFNETEIEIDKTYDEILKEIRKFDKRINKFDYKRLAFDLFDEWEATKIQVIDELGIVKGFVSDIYEEKMEDQRKVIGEKIKILRDRIGVLKAQFDYIRTNGFDKDIDTAISDIIINKEEEPNYIFDNIAQIRKSVFKLDVDIRELLIGNLEFNDLCKDLISEWIEIKIEIQEYLSDLDRQIKGMKDVIVQKSFNIDENVHIADEEQFFGLNDDLAFQLLQGHIQSVITQAIEGFKKINENFKKLGSKLELLNKKKEYAHIRKLINMKSNQIKNFVAETEKQIDNILGTEKIFEADNRFNLYIRPYIEKWQSSKELIINKLKKFVGKNESKLFLNQLRNYLKIMNPIQLNLLASHLEIEIPRLRKLILKFIRKNKLNAKMINDSLYSLDFDNETIDTQELMFFKNIKTLGNKIFLYFKLSNPSNYLFTNIQISLKIPSYLKFLKKKSDPKYLFLEDIKPGKIFKFDYILKIDKDKKIYKDLADPKVDEITLDIYYKDPFSNNRKITKKINLLLP